MPDLVSIYTDGSCLTNPGGPGGWSAILVLEGSDPYYEKVFVGYDEETTNNRMEMTAVLQGLLAIRRPNVRARVYSDSKYVINGLAKTKDVGTPWVNGWLKRGWINSKGEPVANQELWVQLLAARERLAHKPEFIHIRGHRGHVYNERCDQLAGEQARIARTKRAQAQALLVDPSQNNREYFGGFPV